MEDSKADVIISHLKGIENTLEYLEAQIEYTQSILGSFHPDPVIRDHCQHHLKTGAEEIYTDRTIERLKAQFPPKDVDTFLRGFLREAIQKLDTVAIKYPQEDC